MSTILVQACWRVGGASVYVVSNTLRKFFSSLAKAARLVGKGFKGFYNSSLIIWKCCCIGEELPWGGWVIGALKYCSNSLGTKVRTLEGEAGFRGGKTRFFWGRIQLSFFSYYRASQWVIGWTLALASPAEELSCNAIVWGGLWTIGTSVTFSSSSEERG